MATQKERRIIYEVIALLLVGILGALSLPELFNAHNTNALYAGGFLFLAYIGWFISFFIRVNRG
jgi:hypothetical protein